MIEATPESAFAFTRLTSLVVCSWPLHRNPTICQRIVYNIKWCIVWITLLLMILPIVYSAMRNSRNVLSFTRSLFGGFSATQVCVKMILFKVNYEKYQDLFEEVEKDIQNATAEEKEVYVFYVKRCGALHVVMMVCACISAFLICVAPIKVDQPFPAMCEFPFRVDYHPVYDLIYFNQCAASMLCAFIPVFDAQIAMLLWYASAKLELLGNELQSATSIQIFVECIKKHQYLLSFIDQVVTCGRFVLVTTIVACTVGVITSGIHLVANEVMYDKIAFVNLSIAFSLVLYLSAWPSEHLTQMCLRVGASLFNSPWIRNSKELNQYVIFMMHRSQKTPAIKVTGIIPQLSLPYYATFLSRSFSYFTTLRVVLSKMEIKDD